MKKRISLILALVIAATLVFSSCEKECPHVWTVVGSTATCTEDGITTLMCVKCNKTYDEFEPMSHTYKIEFAVSPTCTQPGLTEGCYCEVCGEVFEEQKEIAAYGHIFSGDDDVDCNICGGVR